MDPDFPKNHQTIGKHKHSDGNTIILCGNQEDQMLKPPQSQHDDLFDSFRLSLQFWH
jgi:hypothetical protein